VCVAVKDENGLGGPFFLFFIIFVLFRKYGKRYENGIGYCRNHRNTVELTYRLLLYLLETFDNFLDLSRIFLA
jgi:hypothetical protein